MKKQITELLVSVFFKMKKRSTPQVSFESHVEKAKSVIVFIADNDQYLQMGMSIVRQLQRSGKEITVILPNRLRTHYENIPGVQFLDFFITDMNRLMLPTRAFRNRLQHLHADVLISIAGSECYFSLLCGYSIDAAFKIGAKTRYSDQVFQVQFAWGQDSSANSAINLIHYCVKI